MAIYNGLNYLHTQVNDAGNDTFYIDFGTAQKRVFTQLSIGSNDVDTGLLYTIGQCTDNAGSSLALFGLHYLPTPILYPERANVVSATDHSTLVTYTRYLQVVTNAKIGTQAVINGSYIEYPSDHPVLSLMQVALGTVPDVSGTTAVILAGPTNPAQTYIVKSVFVSRVSSTSPYAMYCGVIRTTDTPYTPIPVSQAIELQGNSVQLLGSDVYLTPNLSLVLRAVGTGDGGDEDCNVTVVYNIVG